MIDRWLIEQAHSLMKMVINIPSHIVFSNFKTTFSTVIYAFSFTHSDRIKYQSK